MGVLARTIAAYMTCVTVSVVGLVAIGAFSAVSYALRLARGNGANHVG